jgi:hypothetical protein
MPSLQSLISDTSISNRAWINIGNDGRFEAGELRSANFVGRALQGLKRILDSSVQDYNRAVTTAYLDHLASQDPAFADAVREQLGDRLQLGKPITLRAIRQLAATAIAPKAVEKAEAALSKPTDLAGLREASRSLELAKSNLSPSYHARELLELEKLSNKIASVQEPRVPSHIQDEAKTAFALAKEIKSWERGELPAPLQQISAKKGELNNLVSKHEGEFEEAVTLLFDCLDESGDNSRVDKLIGLLKEVPNNPTSLGKALDPANRKLLSRYQAAVRDVFEKGQTSVSFKNGKKVGADELLEALHGEIRDSLQAYDSTTNEKIASRIIGLGDAISAILDDPSVKSGAKPFASTSADASEVENFQAATELLGFLVGGGLGEDGYARTLLGSATTAASSGIKADRETAKTLNPITLAEGGRTKVGTVPREELEKDFDANRIQLPKLDHDEVKLLPSGYRDNLRFARHRAADQGGVRASSEKVSLKEDQKSLRDLELLPHPGGYLLSEATSYRATGRTLGKLAAEFSTNQTGRTSKPSQPDARAIFVLGDQGTLDPAAAERLLDQTGRAHGLTLDTQIWDLHSGIESQLNVYATTEFQKAVCPRDGDVLAPINPLQGGREIRTVIPDPDRKGSFLVSASQDLSARQLAYTSTPPGGFPEIRKFDAPDEKVFRGRYETQLRITFDLANPGAKPTVEALDCKALLTVEDLPA